MGVLPLQCIGGSDLLIPVGFVRHLPNVIVTNLTS